MKSLVTFCYLFIFLFLAAASAQYNPYNSGKILLGEGALAEQVMVYSNEYGEYRCSYTYTPELIMLVELYETRENENWVNSERFTNVYDENNYWVSYIYEYWNDGEWAEYDIWNMTGHFLKIVSFYLIYTAIVRTGFEEPYRLLFSNLHQSRHEKELLFGDLRAALDEVKILRGFIPI